MGRSFIDMTGQHFGELTCISYEGQSKWKCLCSCGKYHIIHRRHLIDNSTKSCGHLKHNQNTHNFDRMWEIQKRYNTNLLQINKKTPQSNNTSGVKGVDYHKTRREWRARIYIAKKVYCKWFANKEDAIKWREKAVKDYYDPIIEYAKSKGDIL